MNSKIFAFEHACGLYDSGFSIISLHRTKAGAFKAMLKHRNEYFMIDRNLGIDPTEIGSLDRWTIREYELLD